MKWITREEEAMFPEFNSFQSAWNYFVSNYDKAIVLESVDIIDGVKCYYCALIIDLCTYREMFRLLEAGSPVMGLKHLHCRQPIQIFEDGHIHIVH